ncbi:MAG: hypothetical protein ACLR5G_09865 [Eubacteriales bacterium]
MTYSTAKTRKLSAVVMMSRDMFVRLNSVSILLTNGNANPRCRPANISGRKKTVSVAS